ncbi:MAG: hypothetical protein C4527_15630 [Candidatus Omnitrophota bacterium]|nr:MAG: hypothetical protein C4527_15630 [Candidatus Omnitrophota bacterium]
MVRGKKGRKSVTNVQDMQDSRAADSPEKNTGRRQRFAFWEYVLVCIFFILFCYLQKYVAFKILRGAELEELALNFFFDTLWKGFVIVALLVWLHDFFYKDVEDNIP